MWLGFGQYAGRQEILDVQDKGVTDDRVSAGLPFIQEPRKFNMGQNALGLQECIYLAERTFP